MKSLSLSLRDELLRRAIDSNSEQSIETIRTVLGPFVESTATMIEKVFTNFSLVEDTIRLKIDHFKEFCAKSEKRTSETVHIAGLPWCIQCTAVPLSDQTGTISYGSAFHLYLNRLPSDLPVSCKTRLVFRLKNQMGNADFLRSTSANFEREDGFGFAYFAYLSEIEDPEFGYIRNDAVIFEVCATVKELTQKKPNASN